MKIESNRIYTIKFKKEKIPKFYTIVLVFILFRSGIYKRDSLKIDINL